MTLRNFEELKREKDGATIFGRLQPDSCKCVKKGGSLLITCTQSLAKLMSV